MRKHKNKIKRIVALKRKRISKIISKGIINICSGRRVQVFTSLMTEDERKEKFNKLFGFENLVFYDCDGDEKKAKEIAEKLINF